MDLNPVFCYVYIKDALFDSRDQNLSMLFAVYDVDVIGTCLHHIFQLPEVCSVLCNYVHTYHIGNIDATVIAERPKLGSYREEMRSRISETLGLEKSRISIKATTTEKLGFTGRGEGIAAEAVCSLYR